MVSLWNGAKEKDSADQLFWYWFLLWDCIYKYSCILIWPELLSGNTTPPSAQDTWLLKIWLRVGEEKTGSLSRRVTAIFHRSSATLRPTRSSLIDWSWFALSDGPTSSVPWGPPEMCLPVSDASVGSAPRKFKSSCHKPWKRKCVAKNVWMGETYRVCS